MATFNINAVDRRIQYTSTGQTAFNFNFQVNASSELQVYIDDTLKTETTHYSVSLNTDGTGTVTFNSATTSGEIITIIGDQPLSRTTVFQTGQANDPATLETEFDNVLIRQQQLKEITDRSIQLKVTTPRTVTGSGTSGPLEFPYDATTSNNADRIIKYNSAGTGLETGGTVANIDALAAVSTEISLLGTSSNITAMGLLGNSTVIADMALLGTSDVIADMALLADADVIADMNTLATTDIVSDLNTLATTDIVSDLNTLATSDIVSDLNTLATSDIVSDINTLATSDIVSDLNTLATSDFVSDLNTIATSANVTAINNVSGSIGNVNTVATNLSSVNNFADQYRVGSSDPTSSLDEGDLFYNSTGNVLKYYNGSAWVSITSGGITSVAQDTTPQLGGDLDVNGQSIVSASNGNISITPNGSGKVILDGLSHPTSDGSAGQFLKTDGGGNLSFATITTDLSADTSPQLGGNLDVQANEINTSTTNGNVKLNPNGTGLIEIKGATNAGTIQLNCENNSHGIKLKSPPHSAAQSYTLTFPSTAPSADKILQTDGSGNLSFADVSGGTDWQSSVKTANFTAAAGEGYFVDTSGGAFEIDLPGSPSVGDQIEFVDFSRSFASNSLTLDQGSVKFQGNTSPKPVYTTAGQNIKIVYSGSTQGWIPLVDDDVTMETPQNYSIDFLVVAGGGGSSTGNTGGGGAGGYRTSTQTVDGGTVITVTVGDGGGSAGSVSNGTDSSFSGTGLTTITSTGGGAGRSGSTVGNSGGSGGGSGYNTGTGGSGNTPATTPSQGNNGGGGQNGSPYRGGGGGGAGSSGTSGPSGAHGGSGTANSITGSSVTYAGGGGGSAEHSATAGNAGSGGGGAGGNATQNGGNGTANTGGGGGGTYLPNTPGQGGSGVVILSVPTSNYSSTTSGSPTVTTSGSNTIIKFTGSGSYTA
jgi:hypothetical protein